MIGLDLLEVERLERALERWPRLAQRLFTEAEREYAAGRARPGEHLAARFCAKEAVAKALGLGGWSFRDVEVVATDDAPSVALTGAAAARAAELGVHCSVSLTHTAATAGAVAIAMPAGAPPGSAAARAGSAAARPGSAAARPGSAAARPGSAAARPA